MTTGGGTPRGPMPKQGNPKSTRCRHCGSEKASLRGGLFCNQCDVPVIGNTLVQPTWQQGCS